MFWAAAVFEKRRAEAGAKEVRRLELTKPLEAASERDERNDIVCYKPALSARKTLLLYVPGLGKFGRRAWRHVVPEHGSPTLIKLANLRATCRGVSVLLARINNSIVYKNPKKPADQLW